MSGDWLRSLRVGSVILIPYRGVVEELTVVREVIPNKTRYTAVMVKRPHLQRLFALTEAGNQVGFMWHSSRKTYHDFNGWKVIFPALE